MPFISNDVVSILTIILFGFSGSFIATMSLIKYQERFNTPNEKSRGGFFINIFMEVGLFVGSVASTILIPIFKNTD